MSVEHRVPLCPSQYGIGLYQNYKIPQQRKTLISHFSAPVVSFHFPSFAAHNITYWNTDVWLVCFCCPLAECVGELPSGHGLLREDRQGDRQPCGGPECCHGGGARVEGETQPQVLSQLCQQCCRQPGEASRQMAPFIFARIFIQSIVPVWIFFIYLDRDKCCLSFHKAEGLMAKVADYV